MVRKSLVYTNNGLRIARIRLLLSERDGLLEQKIEPRMVTGGNNNFAQYCNKIGCIFRATSLLDYSNLSYINWYRS